MPLPSHCNQPTPHSAPACECPECWGYAGSAEQKGCARAQQPRATEPTPRAKANGQHPTGSLPGNNYATGTPGGASCCAFGEMGGIWAPAHGAARGLHAPVLGSNPAQGNVTSPALGVRPTVPNTAQSLP